MTGGVIPAAVLELLPAEAWIVGGAVRDEILGRPVLDVDLVVKSDPEIAARAFASAAGKAAVFGLNDEFGAWRVVHHLDRWQVDFSPMDGLTIEDDLSRRDLTINAIARRVGTDELIDPFGGIGDLEAHRLREVGPDSFESDPLRVLRLARFAVVMGFEPQPSTVELAKVSSAALAQISGERTFMEFSRIIASRDPVGGIRLLKELGAVSSVLPELLELESVAQGRYHHLDCLEHTLLVLQEAVNLQGNLASLGPSGQLASDLLDGDLGDGISRWTGVRLAAILHDIAKGRTRTEFPDGRVGFPGHDELGAQMAGEILRRFRVSSRVSTAVRGMIEQHLAAGFLTHKEPVGRREVYEYLCTCGQTAVDVTVLSVADRLATKGRGSDEAIERHLHLTDRLLEAAAAHEVEGELKPLIRGDELASSLGIPQGPQLGVLLSELATAQYAGDISTSEAAIKHARSFLSEG